jgi:hypothetical protein
MQETCQYKMYVRLVIQVALMLTKYLAFNQAREKMNNICLKDTVTC